MDYKRAYEELREVYLKDKQAYAELVELVLMKIEITDVFVWIDTCTPYNANRKSWLRNTNAFMEALSCSQEVSKALRKAAGKD
jgi:hypothetical protein